MIALGLACVVVGGFSYELEIAWRAECSSKAFVELSNSPWNTQRPALPTDTLERWGMLVVLLLNRYMAYSSRARSL